MYYKYKFSKGTFLIQNVRV